MIDVFVTRQLAVDCDVLAPDGSEVRFLAVSGRGSMAHFRLLPGQVSKAVAHHSVEELWYIVSGEGQMWRSHHGEEAVTPLKPGVSLSIPMGTSFQFRCDGNVALEAIGVTMPPWPGMDEAYEVIGPWPTSVRDV